MEFFTNRIEVFDTVDHNTLLRGASSFLACFRHFQWSKSVLTQCFNVTRFVLGSSLLLRSRKYICRGESPLLVSNFTRVSKKVKRGKILVAGLWVYRLTTPQPVLNKLQPVSSNLEGKTLTNQVGSCISKKITTCSCMIYQNNPCQNNCSFYNTL